MMGATGLLLCGFLIMHLGGNCLIYLGPTAFNTYAHILISNPFIKVAEAGLLSIFIIHIFLAFRLFIENKRARGRSYYIKKHTGRGTTFASFTMPYTGIITLVFLIFHLLHIKFGPHYVTAHPSGVVIRDFYRLLVEYFASPWTVSWYIFAQICLGLHVSHGFWSAFQSLGFNHPRYTRWLKIIAKIYGVIIAVGFSALPLYLSSRMGY